MPARYFIDENGYKLILATDLVNNEAYGAGWNTVENQAPSKNSVYSKVESLSSEMFTLAAIMGTL